MSIFTAIIEAVTGNIQDPSDYEYESDEDDDNDLEEDSTDESIDKPWWTDWL